MRMVWWIMPRISLDTYFFKYKTAAKTQKIVQEVEKPQRKNANWGQGAHGHSSQEAPPCVQHHISCSPPRADRGGVCPWSSLLCFVASSFALPNPWYLLCYAYVESFWAFLAIFFDTLGLEKHLRILWFRFVKLNSAKNAQNKQNHA